MQKISLVSAEISAGFSRNFRFISAEVPLIWTEVPLISAEMPLINAEVPLIQRESATPPLSFHS
jgi:hypothetical protein